MQQIKDAVKDDTSFGYYAKCSAHLWSFPRYSSFLGNLPSNTKVFLRGLKKADLSKGYQNPKRKLGVTMHFSEIIELKFGKKLPYILCILKLFF